MATVTDIPNIHLKTVEMTIDEVLAMKLSTDQPFGLGSEVAKIVAAKLNVKPGCTIVYSQGAKVFIDISTDPNTDVGAATLLKHKEHPGLPY